LTVTKYVQNVHHWQEQEHASVGQPLAGSLSGRYLDNQNLDSQNLDSQNRVKARVSIRVRVFVRVKDVLGLELVSVFGLGLGLRLVMTREGGYDCPVCDCPDFDCPD